MEDLELSYRCKFAKEIKDMVLNFRKQNTKGDISEYIVAYCDGILNGKYE